MTGDSVLFERADGVAVLTLNRPSAKNAIDIPTTDALVAALRGLRAADDIRAVRRRAKPQSLLTKPRHIVKAALMKQQQILHDETLK